MKSQTKLRVISAPAPKVPAIPLADEIEDYFRIEAEQRDRKARIMEAGRSIALADGRKVMPRFIDIVRDHRTSPALIAKDALTVGDE